MQMGFYFDQTRCTGCYACAVACKDWHGVPPGPAAWRKVSTLERGKYPNPYLAYLTTSCYHCADPSCVSACPVGAITKRSKDGVVIVSQDKCLGKNNCDMCQQACPYRAPQFGDEDNAKVQMCNFCLDRLKENSKPVCVTACPMRALDVGPINKLRAKYGDIKDAVGFEYSRENNPSITFKSKGPVT